MTKVSLTSRQRIYGWCSTAVVFSLACFAGAQTVLIDFGNDTSYRGASVNNPDSNGNYWNSLQTGLFYTDLIDVNNVVTSVDFGFSSNVATDSYNGPAGPTSEPVTPDQVAATDIDPIPLGNLGGALAAAFDYVAGPDSSPDEVLFQLQGLDPAKTYDLTFFGSHKFNNANPGGFTDNTTRYSVYTDDTFTTEVAAAELLVGEGFAHNVDQVATINDLSPQTDNILFVKFVGVQGGKGYLNSMQIEAIDREVNGDFNNDGVWNCLDLDALVTEVVAGTNTASFDMNGDGQVNAADVREANVGWLAVGGANNVAETGGNPFLDGDANLDGSVDVSDFNVWNSNKFTPTSAWCAGDFTVDGSIDVSDFNLWNSNKFSNSAGGVVLVPEPGTTTLSLTCVLMGGLFTWRKR